MTSSDYAVKHMSKELVGEMQGVVKSIELKTYNVKDE